MEDTKPHTKAPKIQRHPAHLQRRRIDHQKDQKADSDAHLAERVAEKKAKVAVIEAVHKTA
ncbi:hypothetical protein H0H92_012231 [Tricholoma furcatifolium]|nr:hypothetical protein H0H92_012231 [Tricholoma furcatifolium]